MSQNQTSTASDDKILCTVKKVKADSLPHSLHHTGEGCAFLDAENLIAFLEEFACRCHMVDHNGPEAFADARAWIGMELVLKLLRDKIEISTGKYKFPWHGDEDDPALVKRGR
jgi:hypothetical protein